MNKEEGQGKGEDLIEEVSGVWTWQGNGERRYWIRTQLRKRFQGEGKQKT